MSKFYAFRQNNSGGTFVINDKLTGLVLIEAYSPRDANARAEELGIYFDGCNKGIDCDCCGDRWDPAEEYDGEDFPHYYGEPLDEYYKDVAAYRWTNPIAVVYHLDGEVEWYGGKEE